MADDLDVKLVISAQNKARAIIADLNRSLSGTKKGFSAVGVAGAAATASIAAVAATAAVTATALAGIGVVSVKAASDAQETYSKFGTVFDDVSEDAKNSANKLADSFGLSGLQARRLLGDTGDLLTGFGFGGKEALNMSNSVNELAVDLASFTNAQGGAEAVSDALTKALLGERESLKTYGIAIQEADIDAKLLEQGMSGLTGEALRQAKAQATLELAYSQSKNAVGDYARTADSFANRIRAAKAKVEDLTVAIGGIDEEGNLVPGGLLDTATKILGSMIDFLKQNEQKIKDVANAMAQGLAKAIGWIGDVIIKVKESVDEGMRKWNDYEGTIGKARKVIEQLVAYFKEEFITAWNDLREAIEPHLPEIKKWAKYLGGALLVAIGVVITAVATIVLWLTKAVAWVIKARDSFLKMQKEGLVIVGNGLIWLGEKISGAVSWFLNMKKTVDNAMIAMVGAVVGFATNFGAAIAGVVNTVVGFKDQVQAKFNELITGALEWGRHMLQNFADGIWQGISNVGDSLESAKNFIKDKIGFSKNKDIPSEVWGLHMMQNFAGGIEEGNEEMEAALNDAVETAKERIGAFTETFDTLQEKTKEAWSEFKDATKDAKKTYRETMNDIKQKTKEVRRSFKEDFAGAVLDIRESIKGLNEELNSTNISYDQQMAEKFVDAEDSIKQSKLELDAEMAKSEQDRDAERISEIQANITEQQDFLKKHADTIKGIEEVVSEERRIRGLDEVELLKEQKAQETAIIQEQINAEQAVLDAHAEKIRQYNGAIVEEKRIRGMDELAILLENFSIEKTELQKQEDAAFDIKSKSMKRARKRYKKYLKNITKDTKKAVKDMASEFDTIPVNMSDALQKLSDRLINAGSKIKGNTTNNTDNSKSFSITVQGGGGENQNDLINRLGVLLKTL